MHTPRRDSLPAVPLDAVRRSGPAYTGVTPLRLAGPPEPEALHDSAPSVVAAAPPSAGVSAVAAPQAPAATAASEPASGFWLQTFSSLRYRDYRFLWTGTVFMSAGQWIQQVTLGWLAYEMTGSPVVLGVLNGVRTLPLLLMSPAAGVAADRFDRRRMLILLEMLLAAAALSMGLLVGSGRLEVWHLFAFTVFTGVAWACNQPVRQALVPNVVPSRELLNAVALNSVGFQITKILGPALGGVLIAAFGAHGNFYVQAAAYATVVGAIYLMRVTPTPDQARQSSALSNFTEGLSYVRRTPAVLALLVAGLVPSVVASPYQALMPVFQKDVLGVGPEGLGLMLAAPGVGALLATLLLASIAHSFRRKGLLLLGALFLLGLFLVLFSRTTALPAALAMLVGVGGCHILFAATTNTMLQMIVPDSLRGRVMSIYMLDHGLAPFGALIGGVSTQFVGAPSTVAMMGILVIVLSGVLVWRMPQLREIEA